jgi:hypothetical protein
VATAPFAWTHEKTQVEFDGGTLTINGKQFPLDRIERLSRNLSRSTAQGSWNRLDCGASVFAAGQLASVSFRGDAGTEQWGPWRPLWDQFDDLVRNEIQPRLLHRTIDQVMAGSPVEVGSLGPKGRGRYVVTASDLKARRPFAKPVPWASIIDVSAASGGSYQIVTIDPSGRQRKQLTSLSAAEWDAWQIPLLWSVLRAR